MNRRSFHSKGTVFAVTGTMAFCCLLYGANPTEFVPYIPWPEGIAVSYDDQVLATVYGDRPNTVWAFDENGTSSVFAVLPEPRAILKYLAVSPGYGGFPPGYVYVVRGVDILEISPDGASVRIFATIPEIETGGSEVTFDTVGTFGFDMIVANFFQPGRVWRVDSAGNATLITSFPSLTPLRGFAVAPKSFGIYAGHLLFTAPYYGVFVCMPDGSFEQLVDLMGAWDISFVPRYPRDIGGSGGAFFVATATNPEMQLLEGHITTFPASDFDELEGCAIVTATDMYQFDYYGAGPISICPTETGIQVDTFVDLPKSNRGNDFAKQGIPVPVDINPRKCPNEINPLDAEDSVTVGILGTEYIEVNAIDPASLTLAGVPVEKWSYRDVATPAEPYIGKHFDYVCSGSGKDGNIDILAKFSHSLLLEAIETGLGRPPEDGDQVSLLVTGELLDGSRVAGDDIVTIKLGKKKGKKK